VGGKQSLSKFWGFREGRCRQFKFCRVLSFASGFVSHSCLYNWGLSIVFSVTNTYSYQGLRIQD